MEMTKFLRVTFNFQNNQTFFVSFNEGSEGSSKDLEASNDLDDNLDQEWSQISRMHNRYFHIVISALFFVLGIHFFKQLLYLSLAAFLS